MGSFIWIYFIIIVVVFVILFLIVFLTKSENRKKNIDNAVTIFLFVFMTFALSVSAVYSSIASGDTGGKNADASNKSAHTYYTWATVFAWIGVAIAVIGVIAYIYFRVSYPGTSAVTSGGGGGGGSHGGLVKFCLWSIVAIMAFVGIMSAIGAGYQGGSTSKKGYRAGIIAAVTSIILAVLILAFTLSKGWKEKYEKNKKLKELKEKKAMLDEEKSNLVEMQEIGKQKEKIEAPVKSKSA